MRTHHLWVLRQFHVCHVALVNYLHQLYCASLPQFKVCEVYHNNGVVHSIPLLYYIWFALCFCFVNSIGNLYNCQFHSVDDNADHKTQYFCRVDAAYFFQREVVILFYS